jgi:preprotein translocase SecE subunit
VSLLPTASSPLAETPSDDMVGAYDGLSYGQGLRQEWQQITWPTFGQLARSVATVLLVSIGMTLFLWSVDTFFRTTIGWLVPASGN